MNARLKTSTLALGMAAASAVAIAEPAPIYARNAQGETLDEMGAKMKVRMDKVDAILKALEGRMENLTDAEKADLEKRSKEIKDLSSKIEQLQTDLVNQAKIRSKEESETIAGILVRNTESIEIAKTMLEKRQKGATVTFDGLKARNLIELGGLGENAQYAKNDLNRVQFQPLTVVDLINWAPVQNETVTLLRETVWDLMADIVPEGTIKPETDLGFNTQALTVGTIAHWINVSNQVLADMPLLASYIETRLAYGIRYKLEYFVVNGHIPAQGQAKNFSGLMEAGNHDVVAVSAGDTPLDVLNKAKYRASESYLQPECYILNPQDWGEIERIKGNDGHYIIGVPTGNGVQAFLWGLPVRFSSAQAIGKYWCGNLSVGFDGYIREDVDTQISLEDGDNFKYNIATVRSEMRAAGGVIVPDANVAGDLPKVEEDAPVVNPPVGGGD